MHNVSTTTQDRSSKSRRAVSARVNLRISPQVKAALVQAAKLQRIKLTEFMVKSSPGRRGNSHGERTLFVLSAEKWQEFNAALDAPAARYLPCASFSGNVRFSKPHEFFRRPR